jgi:hypothetical protein
MSHFGEDGEYKGGYGGDYDQNNSPYVTGIRFNAPEGARLPTLADVSGASSSSSSSKSEHELLLESAASVAGVDLSQLPSGVLAMLKEDGDLMSSMRQETIASIANDQDENENENEKSDEQSYFELMAAARGGSAASEGEVTAVDMINRHMLSSLKVHMDNSGSPIEVPRQVDSDSDGDENGNDDWNESNNDDDDERFNYLARVQKLDGESSATATAAASASVTIQVNVDASKRIDALQARLEFADRGDVVSFLLDQYDAVHEFAHAIVARHPKKSAPPASGEGKGKTKQKQVATLTAVAESSDAVRAAAIRPLTGARPWAEWLSKKSIARKDNPFGLAAMEVPSCDDIQAALAELEHQTDGFYPCQEYCSFAAELGAATLGRCRVFVPSGTLGQHDLRMHAYRLRDKLRKSASIRKQSPFVLQHFLPFAQDTDEDFWFGWNTSELDDDKRHHIYCLDEADKAHPPVRVARSFADFVENVALGITIDMLGLEKHGAGDEGTGDEDDAWTSSDDDEQAAPTEQKDEAPDVVTTAVQAPTRMALPPQRFVPFPRKQ